MDDYLKSKRILLVDDEQELLDMVISILNEDGFSNIYTAKNVKDAITYAEKIVPELAILDVMLPDGNGFDLNHNENGCTIFVSVSEINNNCIISVEDNGVGATDEQIERLNNTPHYMVCDTSTAEQRHGLGLLIVRQIIAGHNGKVEIDHSGYKGFKVIMSIPK